MKKILIIYYSQSGQLTEIVKSLVEPLRKTKDFKIVWEELEPVNPYPFPWPVFRFLDVFPESVWMDPPEMKPFSFDPITRFDLIILAYQVWYLAPSLPITGFLKSAEARGMKDKPVITVIGCRDMWLMAQEKVKRCLDQIGAKLIDNVVFVDQGKRVPTLITTPRWLLTGKKEGFWKVFPPAGVSEKDIIEASRFGKAIAQALKHGEIERGEPVLKGLGAVKVDPNNIRFERAAHQNFLLCARFLRGIGRQGQMRRLPFLILFIVFLSCMVLVLLPFALIFKTIINPLRKKSIAEEIRHYEQPSGSSTERLDSGDFGG